MYNKVNSGSNIITLENNYTHRNDSDNKPYNDGDGVEFTRPNVVVEGNGHTIDGKGESGIFKITDKNVTLKNIIFINGYHTDGGGAIYFTHDITLINCTFINNSANTNNNQGGGAIYSDVQETATANIYNCNFTENQATGHGGAIFFRGINLTIDNCTFDNNSVSDTKNGGAIYVYGANETFNITNSNFTNNKAQQGGAIHIYEDQSSDVYLYRNIYLNNTIIGDYGSAIYIESQANINITDSIFLNNKSQVFVSAGGDPNTYGNYNWWGQSADNYDEKPNANNLKMTNWYFLDIPYKYDEGTVIVSLNNLCTKNSNNYVTSKHQSMLQTMTFNLSSVNATFDDTNSNITNTTLINGESGNVGFARSGNPQEPIASITASFETFSFTKEIVELFGDFQKLQMLVDDENLSIINLDQDYVYTVDLDKTTIGVNITRDNLVIDGKGFTIDAKSKSGIFNIRASNVTIKNINFENGKCDNGSAVHYEGHGISFVNCKFERCRATNKGGAFYVDMSDIGDVNFTDCSFIGCLANEGAAVYLDANGLNYNFNRCVFEENSANNGNGLGGALYACQSSGKLTINNSILIYNDGGSKEEDRIIYCQMSDVNIDGNWWGSTADNYEEIPFTTSNNLRPNNWFYLDGVHDSDNRSVEFSLKRYNSADANYNLPSWTFNVRGVNLTVGDKATLDENGKASVKYSKALAETGSITLSYSTPLNLYTVDLTVNLDLVMGDFERLNALISTAISDTIELEQDYIYTVGVDDFEDGITISKQNFIIDGKGHTIDAKGMSRAFNYIAGSYNVTLKNMKIINGYVGEAYTGGGAILVSGEYLSIDNCTFINNIANKTEGGGAIYAQHDNYTLIKNSRFINNSAYLGGAIVLNEYHDGGITDIINTEFIGNKATGTNGGAIYSKILTI